MQLPVTLLLLSASLASAASVESDSYPSLLARSRAEATKNYVPRGPSCSSLKYNPGKVTYNLPEWDQETADVYRYRQQQSVNLGSWFVHEKWMVPSVYECAAGNKVSEIDIAAGTNAKAVLEKQWDTIITEEDFAWLQKVGVNTVRLPIGFWSLGPDFCKGSIYEKYADVYENSWDRVLRGIGWAAKYDIGVLVDLHGAYGSQNGNDHSGVSDGKANLFNNASDQQKTIDALVWMTKQLVKVTNVVGIQALNEPKNAPNLPDFYSRAIKAMRAVPGAEQLPIYVHDGFNMNQWAKWVGQRDDFTVVDHHSYFVFQQAQKTTPVTKLAEQIKSGVSDNIGSATRTARGNLVVDEWGCALAPGSTKVSNLQSATKDYCHSQEKAYRTQSAGYAFWGYTMDGCKEGDSNGWCFKGARGSLLPSTFFSFDAQTAPSGSLTSGGNSTSSSPATSTGGDDDETDDEEGSDDTDDSADAAVTTSASAAAATVSSSAAAAATTSPASSSGGSCQASRKRTAHVRRRHHQRASEQNAHQLGHSQSHAPRRHHTTRAPKSSKGYTDGLALTKKFAESGSRIGFARQYIADKGPKGDDSYAADFLSAIADGEAAHDKALRRRR